MEIRKQYEILVNQKGKVEHEIKDLKEKLLIKTLELRGIEGVMGELHFELFGGDNLKERKSNES